MKFCRAICLQAAGGFLTMHEKGYRQRWCSFQKSGSLTQLQPGYYGNAARYPSNAPSAGGLSWPAIGRNNGAILTGWSANHNVTYVNGTLTANDLRFEQHGEGASPALHGQIHWSR